MLNKLQLPHEFLIGSLDGEEEGLGVVSHPEPRGSVVPDVEVTHGPHVSQGAPE